MNTNDRIIIYTASKDFLNSGWLDKLTISFKNLSKKEDLEKRITATYKPDENLYLSLTSEICSTYMGAFESLMARLEANKLFVETIEKTARELK